MSSIEFSISDVLGRAWKLTKKHGLIIALFIFVAGMVSSMVCQIFMWPMATQPMVINPYAQPTPEEALQWFGVYTTVAPVGILIQLLLQVGVWNMFLSTMRGGQPELSAFKLPVRTYGYFILVSFIVSIIVYVGLFCCIIPGIWLSVRLAYAPLIVFDKPKCTVEEALKGSWQMTNGYFWNLFGLAICAGLIGCLGLLVCCIGIYFTMVIAGFAFVISYEFLKPADKDGDTEDSGSRQSSPVEPSPVAPVASLSEIRQPASEEWSEKPQSPRPESGTKETPGDTKEDEIQPVAGEEVRQDEASSASVALDGLCDVVLVNAGSDREAVLRVVMGTVYGKGAEEIRALLETVPSVIMEQVPRSQAERLKASLEGAGAAVEIR